MHPVRRGLTVVELTVGVLAAALVGALVVPQVERFRREHRVTRLGDAQRAVQQATLQLHGEARRLQGVAQPPCAGPGFGANPPLVSATGHGNLCTSQGRVQIAGLYPAPTLAGIVAGAGLAGEPGTPDADRLARAGYAIVEQAGSLKVQVPGGPDATRCAFVYGPPETAGGPPSVGEAETAGC